MDRRRIDLGDAGEQAAADHLRAAGYGILDLKYRARPGEVDIVAASGDTLVFVEVKTRRGYGYGTPAEAVTPRKQGKIIAAAQCYMKHHGLYDRPMRFDVIEVLLAGGRAKINHIENAFGHYGR
ncbi:MAG TPA: YraN family protein [Negativicutes bacterium]|nr:YraN family protein [Negativicutes bacterium]